MPKGYELPKSTGNYTKFDKGVNRLRILDGPLVGWEDWKDGKPVRFAYTDKPDYPIVQDKPIKHFWAFKVWNYDAKKIQIWGITQSTIQKELMRLKMDEDWGDPTQYDLKITKEGDGLETKYAVGTGQIKELTEEVADKDSKVQVDLEKLLGGLDPFAFEATSKRDTVTSEDEVPVIDVEEDVDTDKIPW